MIPRSIARAASTEGGRRPASRSVSAKVSTSTPALAARAASAAGDMSGVIPSAGRPTTSGMVRVSRTWGCSLSCASNCRERCFWIAGSSLRVPRYSVLLRRCCW